MDRASGEENKTTKAIFLMISSGERFSVCLPEIELIPHYQQGANDYACGPVCICITLDYLLARARKSKLYYEGIKKIEGLTMDGKTWSSSGTSYDRMKYAIRRMGFGCREIHGDSDKMRLKNLLQAIKDRHPVILGCMADLGSDRYRHYIVLVGIDDKFIYIRDPYPKGRPSKVLIKDYMKNGSLTSWGNNRWGIEVYPR